MSAWKANQFFHGQRHFGDILLNNGAWMNEWVNLYHIKGLFHPFYTGWFLFCCSSMHTHVHIFPPHLEWQLTGLFLHRHIQTTAGRQRPTMWVLATFWCWSAVLLMLTPTWPGAERGGTTRVCPLEWKSGRGYCGFYLCRCLIMDPTPVRKGIETRVGHDCYKTIKDYKS